MTLNGVIALILHFSPNSIALLATVVEDRPIMSVNIVSQFHSFTFGHNLPSLQRDLSAIAALLVIFSLGCCRLLFLLTLFLSAPVSGGCILQWCPVQCFVFWTNKLIDWLVLHFQPPLGEVAIGIVHLRVIGQRVVNFLLVLIEPFC